MWNRERNKKKNNFLEISYTLYSILYVYQRLQTEVCLLNGSSKEWKFYKFAASGAENTNNIKKEVKQKSARVYWHSFSKRNGIKGKYSRILTCATGLLMKKYWTLDLNPICHRPILSQIFNPTELSHIWTTSGSIQEPFGLHANALIYNCLWTVLALLIGWGLSTQWSIYMSAKSLNPALKLKIWLTPKIRNYVFIVAIFFTCKINMNPLYHIIYSVTRIYTLL